MADFAPLKRRKAIPTGEYKSRLEARVAHALAAAGADFQYEPIGFPYTQEKTYTPDFVLPNGIVVEVKGYFPTEDRTKTRLIKQQYPDVDLRLVFSNPHTRIGSKSNTTYAMWANRLGIPWAAESIPVAWTKEKANRRSQSALRALKRKS